MARLALINVPYYSHTGAMTRLAGVLVRQEHEVVVWAPESARSEIEAQGARFEPHSPPLPRVRGYRFAAGLAAITEQFAETLIAKLHADDVQLLIRDSQTPWALVAAEYLGIPSLVSHPMFPIVGPGPTVARAAGSILPDPAAEPEVDAEEQAREAFEATWLSIARRWGVEIADMNGVFHRTSEPTLAFTTEEILGDHELQPGWRCIGPLMAPPPPRAPAPSRPFVYACFGTSYNFRSELFRAVIAGLADEPIDVLISTGKVLISTGREIVSAGELEPLPANVEVREFVPARDVLAQASLQITHGGSNSVHESLLAAVPMVCLPQAFDQVPLATRVQQLGVGLVVDEVATEIRDAVRLLLASAKAQNRAQELSDHLAGYDGEARVQAAIERALSEGPPLRG